MARRDKKEIKILTTFNGQKIPPTRVKSVQQLGLGKDLSSKIEVAIYEDRLLWEPWIEGAEDFQELRTSLKNRGYKVPRKSFTRFSSSEIIQSNVKGLDKVVPAPNTQTNRHAIRKTMLGG